MHLQKIIKRELYGTLTNQFPLFQISEFCFNSPLFKKRVQKNWLTTAKGHFKKGLTNLWDLLMKNQWQIAWLTQIEISVKPCDRARAIYLQMNQLQPKKWRNGHQSHAPAHAFCQKKIFILNGNSSDIVQFW